MFSIKMFSCYLFLKDFTLPLQPKKWQGPTLKVTFHTWVLMQFFPSTILWRRLAVEHVQNIRNIYKRVEIIFWVDILFFRQVTATSASRKVKETLKRRQWSSVLLFTLMFLKLKNSWLSSRMVSTFFSDSTVYPGQSSLFPWMIVELCRTFGNKPLLFDCEGIAP